MAMSSGKRRKQTLAVGPDHLIETLKHIEKSCKAIRQALETAPPGVRFEVPETSLRTRQILPLGRIECGSGNIDPDRLIERLKRKK